MSNQTYEAGGLKSIGWTGNSSGDNAAIAAVAGQIIRVYALTISGGTATDVTFKDGTGGGGTVIGGPHKSVTNIDLEFNPLKYPLFTTSSGNAFNISLGAANAFGGTLWYTQSPT